MIQNFEHNLSLTTHPGRERKSMVEQTITAVATTEFDGLQVSLLVEKQHNWI